MIDLAGMGRKIANFENHKTEDPKENSTKIPVISLRASYSQLP